MVLLWPHVLQSRPLLGLLTAARSMMRDVHEDREGGDFTKRKEGKQETSSLQLEVVMANKWKCAGCE